MRTFQIIEDDGFASIFCNGVFTLKVKLPINWGWLYHHLTHVGLNSTAEPGAFFTQLPESASPTIVSLDGFKRLKEKAGKIGSLTLEDLGL